MFQPEQQIGPYTLIRLLGRGGSGEVWLAEKSASLLPRKVALKLPLDLNPDLLLIQKEAQTWLKAGHHPNVLPVIDAEVIDGQVVIASEYASGGSLSDWLVRHGGKTPNVESGVEMMRGILAGLEHLHTLKPQPIIHRDLKPDNVLLHDGIPLVTDFGISRIAKTTAYTKHSAGTPSYMPPEAFEGKYSAQSDLWAVGVMFYQMLTGRLPFPQNDIASLYGAIKQYDYDPLPPDVPEPIQEFVAKALAKELPQRFASATEMRHALTGERRATMELPDPLPLLLTEAENTKNKPLEKIEKNLPPEKASSPEEPPARIETNTPKPAYRKSAPTWAYAAIPAILALIIVGALLKSVLTRPYDVPDAPQIKTSDKVAITTAIGTFHLAATLKGHTKEVNSVAWSPDSKSLVTGSFDTYAIVWDAATGTQTHTLSGHTLDVTCASYSPDGRFLVTGSGDDTAKIWDAATGEETLTLTGHAAPVWAIAYSPDGKTIVTGSNDKTAKIWDAATGNLIRTLTGHTGSVGAVAYAPDSKTLLTGSADKTAIAWDAATGAKQRVLIAKGVGVDSLACAPDGKTVTTANAQGNLTVWDAASGSQIWTLRKPTAGISAVAYSPDSKFLVTGHSDNAARIWNAATGKAMQILKAHSKEVNAVAWSPDGKAIVTGSWDNTAKIWRVSP